MSCEIVIGLNLSKASKKDGDRGHILQAQAVPNKGWGSAVRPPTFSIVEIIDRDVGDIQYLVGSRSINHDATEIEAYLGLIHPKQSIKYRYRIDIAALPAAERASVLAGRAAMSWATFSTAIRDDWENVTYCVKTAKPDTREAVTHGLLQRIAEKRGLLVVRDALAKLSHQAARDAEVAEKTQAARITGWSKDKVKALEALLRSKHPEIVVASDAAELRVKLAAKFGDVAACANDESLLALCKTLDVAKKLKQE